jgi:hypothetical protein
MNGICAVFSACSRVESSRIDAQDSNFGASWRGGTSAYLPFE